MSKAVRVLEPVSAIHSGLHFLTCASFSKTYSQPNHVTMCFKFNLTLTSHPPTMMNTPRTPQHPTRNPGLSEKHLRLLWRNCVHCIPWAQKPTCLEMFMVNNLGFCGQNFYFSWFWGLMVQLGSTKFTSKTWPLRRRCFLHWGSAK